MAAPTPPPIDHDRAEVLDLRGLAQRPDQVEDHIPGAQHVEQLGRLADALNDQRDRSFLRVGIGDGQRNALAMSVQPDDHELPGLAFLGDARRSMTNRLTSGARNSASTIGNIRSNLGKEVATGRAGDSQSSLLACIGPDRQLASHKARRIWCAYHTKKRAIVATYSLQADDPWVGQAS